MKLAFLPGHGIGPDIVAEAVKILGAGGVVDVDLCDQESGHASFLLVALFGAIHCARAHSIRHAATLVSIVRNACGIRPNNSFDIPWPLR